MSFSSVLPIRESIPLCLVLPQGLIWSELRFVFEAKDDIHLPPYAGSTWRGAFGMALRQATCTLPRKNCEGCLVSGSCVYLHLIETRPPRDSEKMTLYPQVPHPFILRPDLPMGDEVAKGGSLSVEIVLIGERARAVFPHVLLAMKQAGEGGLGWQKGRARLIRVEGKDGEQSVPLYEAETDRILRDPPVTTVAGLGNGTSGTGITLHFRTPVAIKFQEKMARELPFHVLVRNLLRRVGSLSYFHGKREESDWDYRYWIAEAEKVKTVEHEMRWVEWERYSARQERRVPLGGLVGRVGYLGDELSRFLPLLRLGERLHAGKATSFGLGRYEIEEARK